MWLRVRLRVRGEGWRVRPPVAPDLHLVMATHLPLGALPTRDAEGKREQRGAELRACAGRASVHIHVVAHEVVAVRRAHYLPGAMSYGYNLRHMRSQPPIHGVTASVT